MLTKVLAFALPVICALPFISWQDSKPASRSAEAAAPEFDMEKYMAVATKLATPGKEHKALAMLEGDWAVTTKYRMGGKEAPWQDGTATSTYKSILGGRYVIQTYKAEFMGMPYEGFQILGYDNLKKVYTSSWRDSMSTWSVHTAGTATKDGKTITMTGKMVDAMSPKGRNMKTIIKNVSPTEQHFEMYDTMAGEEVMVMTMISKKKK